MSLKEISDDLDLKKRFPGYFNKTVFRICILLMVAWVGFILVSNDFKLEFISVSCPGDGRQCENPFYICPDSEFYDPFLNCYASDSVPEKVLKFCSVYLVCDEPYLNPGDFYGDPIPYHIRMTPVIFALMILLAFLINHALYIGGNKK